VVADSAACEDGAEIFLAGLPDFERVFKVLSDEAESFNDRAFLDSGEDAVMSSSSSSQLNNSSFWTDPKINSKHFERVHGGVRFTLEQGLAFLLLFLDLIHSE
jgi:hypothetical protein